MLLLLTGLLMIAALSAAHFSGRRRGAELGWMSARWLAEHRAAHQD
jgi:hypothetical protein